MRILLTIVAAFLIQNINAEVIEEATILTDKTAVYTYLFHKQFELKNPNCHRQVFESRSPKTMIAMGCKLYQLEVGPLSTDAERRWFKASYQCDEGNFPFTANCFLR